MTTAIFIATVFGFGGMLMDFEIGVANRSYGAGEAWSPPGQCTSDICLEDVTSGTGLEFYQHSSAPGFDPVDVHSPGVVFADFNGDIYPDIYAVQGSWNVVVNPGMHNKVFINNSGSGFSDVTMNSITNDDDDGFPDAADTFIEPAFNQRIGRNGIGAVAADYDNDGDIDIYIINAMATNGNGEALNKFGDAVPPGRIDDSNMQNDEFVRNTLLRNDSTLNSIRFTDVTPPTGSGGVGDLEWDGANKLIRGNSLAAAWADVNGDGWLDLYVGNFRGHGTDQTNVGMKNSLYLNIPVSPNDPPWGRSLIRLLPNDPNPDICHRASVRGGPKISWRASPSTTEIDTFTDEQADLGAQADPEGIGAIWEGAIARNGNSALACIFADFNNDRWPDLYVANDTGTGDVLYVSNAMAGFEATDVMVNIAETLQIPTFAEIHHAAGVYFQDAGAAFSDHFGHRTNSAMGVDAGDIDLDGDLDLYVTDQKYSSGADVGGLSNNLFINGLVEGGNPLWKNWVGQDQIDAYWSWGTGLLDLENDGDLDIYVGTNNVEDDTGLQLHDFVFQNQYVDNLGLPVDERLAFVDVSDKSGIDLDFTANTHGTVFADFNLDGKVDVLTASKKPYSAKLYKNVSQTGNSWVHVKLVGDPAKKVSRDALGARVMVTADVNNDGINEMLIREVRSGSGANASSNSLILEFGLGQATSAKVTVYWPGGSMLEQDGPFYGIPLNRAIEITVGQGVTNPWLY